MFIAIRRLSFCALVMLLVVSSGYAAGVPDDCTQLIVGIGAGLEFDARANAIVRAHAGREMGGGRLRRCRYYSARKVWPGAAVWRAKMKAACAKSSATGARRPAFFEIGKIYTYDAQLPAGADFPFHQVTTADAWIDDVNHPDYNRFVTDPDPANPPPWFAKQKMRHNDFAYRWLVEVRHNSDPPVSGAGSAIFFHIRRGVSSPQRWLHDDGGIRSGENDHLAAGAAASLLRASCPKRNTARNGRNGICRRPRRGRSSVEDAVRVCSSRFVYLE